MDESKYLDATNLAKLRIAERVVKDCLFCGNESGFQTSVDRMARELYYLIEYLERKVDKGG